MSALPQPVEARLEPLTIERLDAVCAVEQTAYSHPWTRANFTDSIAVGYHCQCLLAPVAGTGIEAARLSPLTSLGEMLIGYFVAMKGVDEVHLLNITVAPAFQRQGWAPLMLEALTGWSRAQGAQWLWLEVRQSNRRALDIYLRQGYRTVGVRKGYYPGAEGGREDAIVMSMRLNETGSAWGALR
jgi:ribosomal-protein-alanine N-acetyltransferase